MAKYPSRKDLKPEQAEALERAAFLILSAQEEASAMLARAGVREDPFGHGRHCRALVDGRPCGCSNYTGNGGRCLTRTTQDPGATPVPLQTCGHLASQHIGDNPEDPDVG